MVEHEQFHMIQSNIKWLPIAPPDLGEVQGAHTLAELNV